MYRLIKGEGKPLFTFETTRGGRPLFDKHDLLVKFDKIVWKRTEPWPFEAVGIAQAIVISAMSTCLTRTRGLIGYSRSHKAVCMAYQGPARGDNRCQEKGCLLCSNQSCPGLIPELLLAANTRQIESLKEGIVFSTDVPTRKGFKPLWKAGVSDVIYLSSEQSETDDFEYIARHRGANVQKFAQKMQNCSNPAFWVEKVKQVREIIDSMEKPISFEEAGILLAILNSGRVHCVKQKAGCVGFDYDGRLLGGSYNGPLPGDAHCDECGCEKDDGGFCIGGHAEQNLIDNIADTKDLEGGTVFVTLFPCLECMTVLAHCRVRKIICYNEYIREPSKKDASPSEWPAVKDLAEKTGVSIYHYTADGLVLMTKSRE